MSREPPMSAARPEAGLSHWDSCLWKQQQLSWLPLTTPSQLRLQPAGSTSPGSNWQYQGDALGMSMSSDMSSTHDGLSTLVNVPLRQSTSEASALVKEKGLLSFLLRVFVGSASPLARWVDRPLWNMGMELELKLGWVGWCWLEHDSCKTKSTIRCLRGTLLCNKGNTDFTLERQPERYTGCP